MTRARRLEPIQRIASTREQQAAREWAEARQAAQAAQEQLKALEDYLAGYLSDYERARRERLDPRRMLDYQRFIARLEAAIEEQRKLLALHSAEAERRRAHWEGKRIARGALDKVTERIQERETQEQHRREQRDQDDRRRRRDEK